MKKRGVVSFGFLVFVFLVSMLSVQASSNYTAACDLNLPDAVYRVHDNIELRGVVNRANISNGALVENLSAVPGVNVTLEIITSNNSVFKYSQLYY